MENVLQDINRRFISLPDEDVRRNNQILAALLKPFIEKMRTKDLLFDAMYRCVFFGGSYYDGLKVGKPEEFDLDLLLDIPEYAEPVISDADLPGFVHLQLKKYDAWMRQPEATPSYIQFRQLFDEEFYLNAQRTRAWIRGIVQRALNDYLCSGGAYVLNTCMGNFAVRVKESGPAWTLMITGSQVRMDIDLVTCFVFREDKWPGNSFRSNPFPSKKPEFFIVPKPLRAPEVQVAHRYWRLSFQDQERVLLHDKRTLKPIIKLLKRLRDLQHNCIASYYIKTVLLHIIAEKDEDFWRKPLSEAFMIVLKEYSVFLKEGNIPYYWNPANNLIANVSDSTMENIVRRLAYIIKDIESNPDKPETVAKYLLTKDEYAMFIAPESAGIVPQMEMSNFGAYALADHNQQSRCVIL